MAGPIVGRSNHKPEPREKPKGSTVLDLIPCFGDVVRRGGHDWQTSVYQVNYEGHNIIGALHSLVANAPLWVYVRSG